MLKPLIFEILIFLNLLFKVRKKNTYFKRTFTLSSTRLDIPIVTGELLSKLITQDSEPT